MSSIKGKEREYLNESGSRFRMVAKGTVKHHPDYLVKKAAEKANRNQPKPSHPATIPEPPDVVAKAYKHALSVPTLEDIAASFGVTTDTLRRWRKDRPDIDVAIAKARTRKTKSMIHQVEQQAAGGNLTAVSMWMRYFRKDLDAERLPPNTMVNLQLNIIPPAVDTRDWLEHRGELHIEDKARTLQDQGTPVFKGRPVGCRA